MLGTLWLNVYLLALAGVAWVDTIMDKDTGTDITCLPGFDCAGHEQLYRALGGDPLAAKTRLHLLWPFSKHRPETIVLHSTNSLVVDADRRLEAILEQYPPLRLESMQKLGEAILKAWTPGAMPPVGALYVVLNEMRGTLDTRTTEELVVALRQQLGLNANDLQRRLPWAGLRDVFLQLAIDAGDQVKSSNPLKYYRLYGYVEPEEFGVCGPLWKTPNVLGRHRELQAIESEITPYSIHQAYKAMKERIVNWSQYEKLISEEASTLVDSLKNMADPPPDNLCVKIEKSTPAKTIDYMVGRRVIFALANRLDKRRLLARKIGYVDSANNPDVKGLKGYLRVLDLRDQEYRRPFESDKVYTEEKKWLEGY
jgi:hypothetical protein